ncbi:unknown [Prevotella sp. CAG:732]|nr:unknown [Prevotella sp. CAG:732]
MYLKKIDSARYLTIFFEDTHKNVIFVHIETTDISHS